MTFQQKRDKKYSQKSTWDFSSVKPFFYMLLRPRTFISAWKFIFSILRNFFLIQQMQVFHITHRPVINVQNALDDKIPFEPDKVNTYLGFVAFFIKPLDMLQKRLGYVKAAPYLRQHVKHLAAAYKNASSIYRYSMTTTNRPDYNENVAFKTIHAADPHLLCVPSLHVAICIVIYSCYKAFFKEGILPEEEAQRRLNEIKLRAIAIIESVLFVKQHSVNCIPTAFYMVNAVFGEDFFSAEEAISFFDDIFANSLEITSQVKQEIYEYFTLLFERNFLENSFNDKWQDSIKRWLKDYARQTGQELKRAD